LNTEGHQGMAASYDLDILMTCLESPPRHNSYSHPSFLSYPAIQSYKATIIAPRKDGRIDLVADSPQLTTKQTGIDEHN
jgi:hypothetical protein